MPRPVSLRSPVVLGGALLLAGAAGGIAYAGATAAPTVVIQGCYNTRGALRVITGGACDPGETAISWNQTGPPGPAGARGPAGASGTDSGAKLVAAFARGKKKLPEAFTIAPKKRPKVKALTGVGGGTVAFAVSGAPIAVSSAKTFKVAARLNLPAGRYIVNAKAVTYGSLFPIYGQALAYCTLVGGDQSDEVYGENETFAAMIPLRLKVPGRAELRCLRLGNQVAYVDEIRMSAIRVDALVSKKM
jgi:hypothetical protein